jgi:hypothetical protein
VIILEVIDDEGATASTSISIVVVPPELNNPPAIIILEPSAPSGGVVADMSFTILWVGTDADPEDMDALVIDLYYDTDTEPSAKSLIASGLSNTGSYVWDTSEVPEGDYYILGVITDPRGATGTAYSEGTVTIIHNTPPTAPSNLQPRTTHEIQPILSWVASVDPDGDMITYHVSLWEGDYVEPQSLETLIMDDVTTTNTFVEVQSPLIYGQVYTVEVYADDGRGGISLPARAVLEVVNSAPSAPQITLRPVHALTTDDLVCVILTPADDTDGDEVAYTYTWYRNGELQELLVADTVPAEYTVKGDVWRCVVTPSDGIAEGVAAEAEIIIHNSAPVAIIDSPEPAEEFAAEDGITSPTIKFSARSSADADGDSLIYTWDFGDGTIISGDQD